MWWLDVIKAGGGGVMGGVALAALLAWQREPAEVAAHDRRIADLNSDLRRWVRDRDRWLKDRLAQIVQEFEARGTGSGGGLDEARAIATYQALHEFRDEASGKYREARDLIAGEGRWHQRHRRRGHRPAPQLALPADCLITWRQWRENLGAAGVADPTAPELEPELAALEHRSAARVRDEGAQ